VISDHHVQEFPATEAYLLKQPVARRECWEKSTILEEFYKSHMMEPEKAMSSEV
jgi:hypothetical protein